METFLSAEQRDAFARDGCLVVPDFISPAEADVLREECHRLVDAFDVEHHRNAFHCGEDQAVNFDSYFLESSDKISFFLEKEAMDAEQRVIVDKHRAINKIGHALHWLNPAFRRLTFDARVKAIARDLDFRAPCVCQSMYIFKQPKIGGEVDEHQDASFLWTEPSPKLLGYWVALEDATLENGCLWFAPGSHKDGLRNDRHFFRTAPYTGPTSRLELTAPILPLDKDQFQAAPVKKGSLVLIDGFVVHLSHANRSAKSREIYTWHVVELEGREWSPRNWLQTAEPFRRLYDN